MPRAALFWAGVQGLLAAILIARIGGFWIDRLPGAVWIALLLAAAHLLPSHARMLRAGPLRRFAAAHAFGIGLAVVSIVALLVRLPGYASDLGHVPLDIDEHRLAANIRHFFVTGELLHDTVEHYPGASFWLLSAGSFLGYLRGLGEGRVLYPVHMPIETFVQASRLTNIWVGVAIAVVTGLVGRRAAGPVAGLVAAFVVAIVPLSADTTVLVRNDPAMVLAVIAATYLALVLLDRPQPWIAAAAGAVAGTAAAIKYSGVFAIVPVLIAASASGTVRERIERVALAAAAFVAAVGVTNHFLWADFPNFLRQLTDQVAITGPGHWAASDNPAAFYVMILNRFGPGWPMLLLAAAYAALAMTTRRAERWIVISFPLLYVWFMTGRPSQFPRWVFPVVPFVAVAGAAALTALAGWIGDVTRARTRRLAPAAWAAVAVLVAFVLWPPVSSGAMAFSRRVTPPTHTRVEAWVKAHAAPGSVVLLGTGWLDLRDTDLDVRRVPDLGKALDGDLEDLAGYDWIVVPEIHFGHPALRQLGLVRRVTAARTFGGSLGYDYEVYAVPRLPRR